MNLARAPDKGECECLTGIPFNSAELEKIVQTRLKKAGLPKAKAYIIGSRAAGNCTEESDTDIAVRLPRYEPRSPDDKRNWKYATKLAELAEADARRRGIRSLEDPMSAEDIDIWISRQIDEPAIPLKLLDAVKEACKK